MIDDKAWTLLLDRISGIETSVKDVHIDVKSLHVEKVQTDQKVEKRISKIETRIILIATSVSTGVAIGADKLVLLIKGLL